MCNVAADVMAKLEQTVRQFLDEGRMFTGIFPLILLYLD